MKSLRADLLHNVAMVLKALDMVVSVDTAIVLPIGPIHMEAQVVVMEDTITHPLPMPLAVS